MIVLDRTRLTVTLAFVRKSTLWKRAFLYWLPGALNILRLFLRVVKTWGWVRSLPDLLWVEVA